MHVGAQSLPPSFATFSQMVSKATLFLTLDMSISNNDSSREDTRTSVLPFLGIPLPSINVPSISDRARAAFESISRNTTAILITAVKLHARL